MEMKCPECGQDIDFEGKKTGEAVECPACFAVAEVPEQCFPERDIAASKESKERTPDGQGGMPVARKKAVRTNMILTRRELDELSKAGSRKNYEPVRGWQWVALSFGAALAVFIWGFLLLEMTTRRTFLSSMDINTQRGLVAFFALIAAGLFWFAGKKRLWWCRIIAVLVAAGLPLYVYEREEQVGGDRPDSPVYLTAMDGDIEEREYFPERFEDFRESDIAPMIDENTGYPVSGNYSVWVRGIDSNNESALKSYLRRMSEIRESVLFYPGNAGCGLFVIEGSPMSFDDFITMLKEIGEVRLSGKKFKFADVILNRRLFHPSVSPEVLGDVASPDFVNLNYGELCSYDMDRVHKAADRLAKVQEAGVMKDEVVAQLIKLLNEPWGYNADYVEAMANALVRWCAPGDQRSAETIALVLDVFRQSGRTPRQEWLHFVVDSKYANALNAVFPYWKDDPRRWEGLMLKLGGQAESLVLNVLSDENNAAELRCSGLRVLEATGSGKSLPVLQNLLEHENTDIANLSKAAMRGIKGREAPREG